MKTDELIALLATGETAVEGSNLWQRYSAALGWGAFAATLMMAILLGVRPDLYEAARLPMFWVKLGFPGAMLAGALLAVLRLSRPGAPLGRAAWAIAAPVVVMWLLAAVALMTATPSERDELILGNTWLECLISITFLATPVFGALLWAMRGFAPTRLALAGAAVGLLSGSIGALIYALHCPEMTAPFLGVWYLIGMLIPAAIGALFGARILRW